MNSGSTHIIVVGGGVAGYAAAMAASESARVTLIEKESSLGGATTQSNVGTLCGLYFRSPDARIIPHLFCKTFTEHLLKKDDHARVLSMAGNLHVISYEWSNLQKFLAEDLLAHQITIMTDTSIKSVAVNDGKIKSITVCNGEATHALACSAVVDCTGTGVVAKLLNQEMITSEVYQSAAQVIRLTNITSSSEYSLGLAIKKVLIKNASRLPPPYTGLSVVPGSLRDNQVDLKLPLSTQVNDSTTAVDELKAEAEKFLPELLSIITEVESLSQAEVQKVFPSPGIRIQQRPKGKYILTESDVLSCRKPGNGIALGTWPIEEWDYKGKVHLDLFAENDGYLIPAGCLESPVIQNLYFAGKGISAQLRAIASARVTGTCLQTGYAAGRLAACHSEEEKNEAIQKLFVQIRSL